MTYMFMVLGFCMVVGLIGVSSHPSPYYGVVGLVGSVVVSGGMLVLLGGSFVSLVLFLIYLGGMLVVFAYSIALASEPYPETWGSWFVVMYFISYFLLVLFLGWGLLGFFDMSGVGLIGVDNDGVFWVRVDFTGVSMMYLYGGPCLLICGWGLLLVLFVVLELTRGLARVALRVV